MPASTSCGPTNRPAPRKEGPDGQRIGLPSLSLDGTQASQDLFLEIAGRPL